MHKNKSYVKKACAIFYADITGNVACSPIDFLSIRWRDEHSNGVLWQFDSKGIDRCKGVRSCHLVLSKIGTKKSKTIQVTIFRFFFRF